MTWEHEPDRLEADYKGLKLLILRNSLMGHLCGYVGVPEGDPLYGKDMDKPEVDFDVHGGVTFSQEGDGERWPKGYWWIGFDCAHAWDYVPKLEERYSKLGFPKSDTQYRDIYYTLKETIRLANQILERRCGVHE